VSLLGYPYRRIKKTCDTSATAQSGEGEDKGLEQPISKHVNVAWIVLVITIKQRESERPRLHNVFEALLAQS
jgi:hypothetical protein